MGEDRQFPYAKIIDVILFDFQKHLIESLKNNGFNVVYKKHPKGVLFGKEFLGQISDSYSTETITRALKNYDVIVFEYAGSAFIEAINSGKKVILIDTGQRQFHDGHKANLLKSVKLIDTHWKNNILYVNEKKLISALKDFQKIIIKN